MVVRSNKGRKQEKRIVELENNPVREYLKNNPTKILSINHLKQNLPFSMKKKQIYYYCTNSNFIKRGAPSEVGSGKRELNIFKYVDANMV